MSIYRVPAPTSEEEIVKRIMKRVDVSDVHAMYNIGRMYFEGDLGLPQYYAKALKLYLRAGELGCAAAYNNIGFAYDNGRGVARDGKKARHYYELAAIGGDVCARNNLGILEERSGNMDRALKHYMIAVEYGFDKSLVAIKQFYMTGLATKDDYAKALRSYQAYLDEIKSAGRDEAAAFTDMYRYY